MTTERVQPPPLAPGERAPDFALPTLDGGQARFYALAGGQPTALVYSDTPDGALEDTRALLRGGLTVCRVSRSRDVSGVDGVPTLVDEGGNVGQALRAPAGTTVFALDPALRVLQALPTGPELASQVRAALQTPDPRDEIVVTSQAPIMLLPRALPPQVCAELVQLWETGGHDETGVERSADGRRGDSLVAEAKRRRDHVVDDQQTLRRLTHTVGRRILPEVRHAFAYRADRFEGFKIACYDAERQGHFSAHRDNLSPTTAHRRFALSINLNDGYGGGELRFPEYGAQRYRPPAGAALVFSCSLLHEVLPVTEGERFVLLSFLYAGDRAAGGRSAGG